MSSCSVTRFSDGNIDKVFNQDGTTSVLYEKLKHIYEDEIAFEIFSLTTTDEFAIFNGESNTSDNVSVEKAIEYYNQLAVQSSRPLSNVDKEEVDNIASNLGFISLSSFRDKLKDMLDIDNVRVNVNKAIDSGIFTRQEIEDVDVEGLIELYSKIDRTLSIHGDTLYDEASKAKYRNSENDTIVGGFALVSQNDILDEITNSVKDFRNSSEIDTVVHNLPYNEFIEEYDNNEDFREGVLKRLQNKRRVSVANIDSNGNLNTENSITYNTLVNTLRADIDFVSVETNIEVVEGIHNDVWKDNLKKVQKVLKRVESELAKNGIDIIGLSERVDSIDGVKEYLGALKEFVQAIENDTLSREDIKSFAKTTDEFFNRDNSTEVITVSEAQRGLSLFKLETTLSEAELFNEYGLIKVDDNLYQKVSEENTLEDLYAYLYSNFAEGSFDFLPITVKNSDMSTDEGKIKMTEQIKEYALGLPVDVNIKDREKYALLKIAFGIDLGIRTENELASKQQKISNIKDEGVKYLKGDFVADFYQYVLDEKIKDSFLYNSVLKHFKFTENGIDLTGALSNLNGIEDRFRNSLENYIRLRKDSYMDHLLSNDSSVVNEELVAVNMPELLQELTTDFSVEGGYVISEPNGSDYVKVNGIVYQKKLENEKAALYAPNVTRSDSSVFYEVSPSYSYNEKSASKILSKYNKSKSKNVNESKAKSNVFNALHDKVKNVASNLGVSFQVKDNVSNENEYLEESDFNEDGTVKQSELDEITKEKEFIKSKAIADGTFMKAPNGNDTNLTEEQWLLVRGKRFKNWFGDFNKAYDDFKSGKYKTIEDSLTANNVSHVVDSNGEPKVVLHGSRYSKITEFDRTKKIIESSGLEEYMNYFTDNIELAKMYATKLLSEKFRTYIKNEINKLRELQYNVRNNRDYNEIEEVISELKLLSEPTIYKVFLDIKNPFSFDGDGLDSSHAFKKAKLDLGYKIANDRSSLVEAVSGNNNAYNSKFDGMLVTNIADMESGIFANSEDVIKSRVLKYVGTMYSAINPNQIKSATDNVGTFSNKSNDIRFQISNKEKNAGDNRFLATVHNLTSSDIKNILRLGGLPVPSLAIIDVRNTYNSYGEISLIAGESLADPKSYKNKVFDADIYSPRYPSINIEFKRSKDEIELEQELLDLANKFKEKEYNYVDFNETFRGYPSRSVMAAYIYENNIKVERPEYGDAASKYFSDNPSENLKLMDWIRDKVSKYDTKEVFFDGFTASGKRRYLEHNLGNVVKVLTRGIKNGESFFYGAGNVRAGASKKFKTLQEIKNARDRIVSIEEMEDIKKSFTNELFDIIESLSDKYKYDSSSFSYGDNAKRIISDYASGKKNVLNEIYNDLTTEEINRIDSFIAKLKESPTEYFEAKPQRAVDLSEFEIAVLPKDTPNEIKESLKDKGLKIYEYNRKTEGDRQRVTQHAVTVNDIRFQSSEISSKGGNIKKLISTLKKTGLASDVIVDKNRMSQDLKERFGDDFVIEDLQNKETDLKFLRTNSGNILGYVTPEGVVFLDPSELNAETTIHEFNHLFNRYLMVNRPEQWSKIVELSKQTKLWNAIKNSKNYEVQFKGKEGVELDNAIADEVWSQIVGVRGSEIHEKVMEVANGNRGLFERIMDAIREYFNGLLKMFGFNVSSSNKLDLANVDNISMMVKSDLSNNKLLYNLSDKIKKEVLDELRKEGVQFSAQAPSFSSLSNEALQNRDVRELADTTIGELLGGEMISEKASTPNKVEVRDDLVSVAKKFETELRDYSESKSNNAYLGNPSQILEQVGMNTSKAIETNYSFVKDILSNLDKRITEAQAKSLARAIHNPNAVYTSSNGNINIITSVKNSLGENMLVELKEGETNYKVQDIRSVKESDSVNRANNNGTLKFAKEQSFNSIQTEDVIIEDSLREANKESTLTSDIVNNGIEIVPVTDIEADSFIDKIDNCNG